MLSTGSPRPGREHSPPKLLDRVHFDDLDQGIVPVFRLVLPRSRVEPKLQNAQNQLHPRLSCRIWLAPPTHLPFRVQRVLDRELGRAGEHGDAGAGVEQPGVKSGGRGSFAGSRSIGSLGDGGLGLGDGCLDGGVVGSNCVRVKRSRVHLVQVG